MADQSPEQGSRRRPPPPPSSTPRLRPRISQPQFSAPLPGTLTTPPGSPGGRGTYTVNTDIPPSAPERGKKRANPEHAGGKKTKKRKSKKIKNKKSKKIKNKKSKKKNKKSKRRTKRR